MKMKIFGWLAIAVLIMVFVGCGSTPESGERSSTAKEARSVNVNWDSESTGTLTITNNTQEAFILFAGSISNQGIIGGIKSGPNVTRNFDIFDDVSENNGVFLLRAVRESDYRSEGSKINEDDVKFARLVTYDKNQRNMRTDIIIDNTSAYGGNEIVFFENDSNLVLEIRLDSPTGEKVATLPPFQRKKPVALQPDPQRFGYTYYPTYIYYDEKQHDVRSITTTDLAQGISALPIDPDSGQNVPFVVFPKPNTNNISHPVATLIVRNESDSGVLFRTGASPLRSIRGNGMINGGGEETFELDMNKMTTREIGGLNIDLRKGQENVKQVERKAYQAGWNYTLTLGRDGNLTWSEDGYLPDANRLNISLVNEIR
ncbi:hypothetical protein AGMMS49940_04160 [Spirochaetia bacterium]|nr:hypothetical protein AGMMS49940_04160 [Spirochaetia bacterium]